MEFTAEQQAYIDNLIAEKTANLYTEEDLQRKVTAEVDRRVESGIQKGLKTHRDKWEKEFEKKAKMTAEELAQEELELKLADMKAKEVELSKRANRLDAMDILSGADIPKTQYENFLDLLVSDDVDTTKSNVENFINNFNATKTELEKQIQEKLSSVPAPKGGDGGVAVSKDDFDNMNYMDKLKFKESNPDLYKQFIE